MHRPLATQILALSHRIIRSDFMDALGYQTEVLRTVAAIEQSAGDWDGLADRWNSPLFKADWFVACAQTLCHESDLRVVVVRYQGALCAVAPLVLVRRNGVEWLELLGASVLGEPAGLIFDRRESLHQLVKIIVGLRIPIALDRIPADSPIALEVRDVARHRGMVITRSVASAAYVMTQGSWEDYFRSLSAQRRYDYQRKRKRTECAGQVGVRIEQPTSRDRLLAMLDDLFRIEAAGWKHRSGSAMLANDRVRQFIVRYSEKAQARGMLRLCFLDVQSQPIAAILGVEDAQRFWVLKIGYDEDWARCSPGIQLTMETIKYAFDRGLEAYEFLGSEEAWQAVWPRSRHAFMSLVLYPFTVPGLRGLGCDVGRFVWKKMPGVSVASSNRQHV